MSRENQRKRLRYGGPAKLSGQERASIMNKGAVAIDRGCTAPDTMHEQRKSKEKTTIGGIPTKLLTPCGGERASIMNKGAVAIDRGCTAPDTMHEQRKSKEKITILVFPQNCAVRRELA